MFSSLARRISPRLIDKLDLVVELSTLGEYAVDRDGVFALDAVDEDGTPSSERARPAVARLREGCPLRTRVSRPCRDASARL